MYFFQQTVIIVTFSKHIINCRYLLLINLDVSLSILFQIVSEDRYDRHDRRDGIGLVKSVYKRKALATPFFVICISSSHSFFKSLRFIYTLFQPSEFKITIQLKTNDNSRTNADKSGHCAYVRRRSLLLLRI